MITGFLNGSIIRGFAGYYGCYILKLLKPPSLPIVIGTSLTGEGESKIIPPCGTGKGAN
jgi:hypothetical protein